MSRHHVMAVVFCCLVTSAVFSQLALPAAMAVPSPSQQRQLVPAYFRPTTSGNDSNPWVAMCTRMKVGSPGNKSVAIMNPASGPGTTRDPLYTTAITKCHGQGHLVVGYLTSDYGHKTVSQVATEITTYRNLYPGLDGIFVDEMLNCEVCIFQNGMSVPTYYGKIYDYVKSTSAAAGKTGLVVGNPGAAASSNWQIDSTPVADVIVVFEGTSSSFATWNPPGWVLTSPSSRLSQIVYATPSANRASVCAKTRTTNAGNIYVTDDVFPNPFDRLPSYWTQVAPACT